MKGIIKQICFIKEKKKKRDKNKNVIKHVRKVNINIDNTIQKERDGFNSMV